MQQTPIYQAPIHIGHETLLAARKEYSEGHWRSLPIRQGLALTIADLTYTQDVDRNHVGGEYLKFHYRLEGQTTVSPESGDLQHISAGNVSFLVQPSDSLKRMKVRVGVRERSVTLVCTRDFASSILPLTLPNLPRDIGEYLRDRTSRFSLAQRPLVHSMREIVEDIMNPPMTDGLRPLMIEAKALELLCCTIDQILKIPPGLANLPPRSREKVRELCAILESDSGTHLSITELCKLVAWNETQMMEAFKIITGKTISTYRHDVRMALAKRQLLDTDASITEIAFDAGYEHPGNFATAFKRTFGYSPKMARFRRGSMN